jgi:exopolysaccharide biosynthesis WecB/TagA/CpsF family protein
MYFANAHTLNLAWSDPAYREVLNRAHVVLNDGVGLDLYAKLVNASFLENCNGTDLFPRLFAEARREAPLRVFLFGGARGRAARAAANIEARFPGVRVVGHLHGYGRDGVVSTINASGADVVLVGMGNPLQEKWIDENLASLQVGVVAGVGALIDFLSGEVSRAPAFVRTVRCEWLYRLAREPRRMFRRYVLGNPTFLVRSFMYAFLGHGRALAGSSLIFSAKRV